MKNDFRFLPRRVLILIALLTLLLPTLARAATLTVAADGSGQYPTIQAAVNAVSDGDTILLADGTYSGDGNRDIDFNGKNITVTSQNGPSATIIDCGGSSTSDGSGSHRGFYLHSLETKAVISGFTIENGYDDVGGGIYLHGSSAAIQSCNIVGSTVENGGGGVYILNVGTTTLTNCTISGNTTARGIGGGGVYCYNPNGGSTIALTNCTISGNTAAQGHGGGVFNDSTPATVTGSTTTLTNCTVTGNTAALGGGVSSYTGASMIALTNCTISGNTATTQGGGVENLADGVANTITLTNDILYGDTGGEIVNGNGAAPVVSFCDIQGGYPGTGNIDADPLFVYAAGGNQHLKPGSPCLGAGTSAGAPTTDLDGHTRPNPPSIGVYEVAAPGHTHLLWTNTNGAASIWTLSADGTVTSTPAYGPIPGWTAKTIADGPDGKTRLLWRRTDGMSAVWTVNTADGTITSTPGYAPQGGWITVGLAVGPDNLTRLQWEIDPYKRVGLANAVWTLDGAGNVTSTPPYEPDGFWTATALAVGGDGLSRLLWVNGEVPSGQYPFAVWTLNTAGVIASTPLYQPQPDAAWTASAIAGGPDANARLLLNRTDGSMAVWTVDVPGSVASTPLYGPIPGWTCHALAVGPDALSRVLWSRADGMSSVWTISADGSIASTPGYGPIPGWSAVALSVGP